MPCYTYYCKECSHEFQGFSTISRRNEPQPCPKCEKAAPRDVEKELAREVDTRQFEDHTRLSWSLGINPDNPAEVAAAHVRHPGAEFTDKGQMVIHNRQEKLQRMKERGYIEY